MRSTALYCPNIECLAREQVEKNTMDGKITGKDPIDRRYSQQVLRFAEQIQFVSYSQEVKNLISQIGLIEKITVVG